MQIKVLVAYASKYGSTQKVAEAIAATSNEFGFVVDLEPIRRVKVLEEYNAVDWARHSTCSIGTKT